MIRKQLPAPVGNHGEKECAPWYQDPAVTHWQCPPWHLLGYAVLLRVVCMQRIEIIYLLWKLYIGYANPTRACSSRSLGCNERGRVAPRDAVPTRHRPIREQREQGFTRAHAMFVPVGWDEHPQDVNPNNQI
jgi:hypothetical protein